MEFMLSFLLPLIVGGYIYYFFRDPILEVGDIWRNLYGLNPYVDDTYLVKIVGFRKNFKGDIWVQYVDLNTLKESYELDVKSFCKEFIKEENF